MAVNLNEADPCGICTGRQAETRYGGRDELHQICRRCGEFKITNTALAILERGVGIDKRARLSGWALDQFRSGAIPSITSNNLNQIMARHLPSVSERADRLLREAAHGQSGLSIRFNYSEPRFLAATYSSRIEDLHVLMRLLENRGLIENVTMDNTANISPEGLMQLDEIKKTTTSSSQGFVAMWFDRSLDQIYVDGFQRGVFQAGYDPVRIDRVEHINRIDDEIIAQIKASRFLVADFTGHRGGVYFEAGFAMGLDMPIFWTCRRDHIHELHFDIRQFNCIDWEVPEDLARRLASRTEAVLGLGPRGQH